MKKKKCLVQLLVITHELVRVHCTSLNFNLVQITNPNIENHSQYPTFSIDQFFSNLAVLCQTFYSLPRHLFSLSLQLKLKPQVSLNLYISVSRNFTRLVDEWCLIYWNTSKISEQFEFWNQTAYWKHKFLSNSMSILTENLTN
jgi:hypothetical protein